MNRALVPGITIDNPDTKDRDDAIWLEPQENGWLIHVSIADVPSYVKTGSSVDQAARRMGFTVYGEAKTSYMLPERLTKDRCSLDAGQPRNTMTISIALSSDLLAGRPTIEFTRLNSQAQLSYGEADALAENQNDPLGVMIKQGFTLSRELLDFRRSEGALAIFDLKNGWFVDEDGMLQPYQNEDEHQAHILIQELMILTNRVMAEEAVRLGIPQIYRNHVAQIAAPTAKGLADEISQVLSEPGLLRLSSLNQRMGLYLNRATYNAVVLGHYGLSLPAYAHMTSPIRRYADLINWRMWQAHLQEKELPYTQDQLSTIAASLTTIQEERRDKADQHRREMAQIYDKSSSEERLRSLSSDDLHRMLKMRCRESNLNPILEQVVLERFKQGSIRPMGIYHILEATGNPAFDALKAAAWSYLEQKPDIPEFLFRILNTEKGVQIDYQSQKKGGNTLVAGILTNGQQTLTTPLASRSGKISAERKATWWLLNLYYGRDLPEEVQATETGKIIINPTLLEEVERQGPVLGNPKQMFIEAAREHGWATPEITSTSEGLAHKPLFTVEIRLPTGSHAGVGRDIRKTQAEQRAYQDLLRQLLGDMPKSEESTATASIAAMTSNFVGLLGETCISRGWPMPTYSFDRRGVDHSPSFEATCKLQAGSQSISWSATATNKQEAKRLAAKAAFEEVSKHLVQ